MSGLHDGAPDPLAALRASDRRPKAQVLRERLMTKGPAVITAVGGRLAVAALVCVLAVAVGWRLFVESEPPVEASIPFATGAPLEDVSSAGGTEDSAGGAIAVAVTDGVDADTPVTSTVAASATGATGVEGAIDEVVVHVAGAVLRPGLIRGDASWRIDDAVRAAGGELSTADLDRVNLAAPILDGQRIFVPHVDEVAPTVIEPESPALQAGDQGLPVDLNASDVVELQSLPGVGPATAAAIVSHREDFGSFGSVDALVAVPGIGPATLEMLREHVRV